MNKLAELKQRLRNIRPFVVFKFKGLQDELVMEGKPLSVSTHPPSLSFIIESNQITSMIMRYSTSYKEQVAKTRNAALNEAQKTALATKVMNEVTAKAMGTPEDQARQIGVIVGLGKEYLIAKAIDGWYGDTEADEKESFKVRFFSSKIDADEFNAEENQDGLGIAVDLLSDMEVLQVGMELVSAIPTDEMPQIPITDSVVDDETNESKEVVIASVPAESVTTFRRNLRSRPVEDVRPDPPASVGDTERMPSV